MVKTAKANVTQLTALPIPSQALERMEPILDASGKVLEKWVTVGSELLEFSRTRINRSIEAGKAIARSNSLDEAIELQAEFTRSIMRDFLDEASKLADLGTQALLESMRTLQSGARENTEQRPAA